MCKLGFYLNTLNVTRAQVCSKYSRCGYEITIRNAFWKVNVVSLEFSSIFNINKVLLK